MKEISLPTELQVPALVVQTASTPLTWSVDPRLVTEEMRRLWDKLRQEWLAMAHGKNGYDSEHTRVAYTRDSSEFLDWIATQYSSDVDERGDLVPLYPWMVTSGHVRGWIGHMQALGLANSTIARKLAACSSFYSFVINEVHMVGGRERTAFFDRDGNTRQNPFKTGNYIRPAVDPYSKAEPLSVDDLAKLFQFLEEHQGDVAGARNYALLLTYYLTASRNSEVIKLKWGDIRASRKKRGQYVYSWSGKGGKSQEDAFPERCYWAIVGYLRKAGRYMEGMPDAGIQPGEYIFAAIHTAGLDNLRSAQRRPSMVDAAQDARVHHISSHNAVRIFQTALRRAGVANYKRRLHDLRHTYADLFDGDIDDLRRILHHTSLATTTIYKSSLKEAEDRYSERMFQKTLGISE